LSDFLNEARNVDMRRAGGGAWGVEAVEAAVGFRKRGRVVEGRMEVWETGEEFGVRSMCFGQLTLLGDDNDRKKQIFQRASRDSG
jgi:hypothetical protein